MVEYKITDPEAVSGCHSKIFTGRTPEIAGTELSALESSGSTQNFLKGKATGGHGCWEGKKRYSKNTGIAQAMDALDKNSLS